MSGYPLLKGRCRLADIGFRGVTLLSITGMTVNDMTSLLRTLAVWVIFYEEVGDCSIFVIDAELQ